MTNPSVVRIKYGTIIEWSSTMWLVQSVGDIFFSSFALSNFLFLLASIFYLSNFCLFAVYLRIVFTSYIPLEKSFDEIGESKYSNDII